MDYITCDQLREEFLKCKDDVNKRMLMVDVRNSKLYEKSHLCLAPRDDIPSIRTKMRVINIDPDRVGVCTSKKIMENLLKGDDLRVFKKRRDATEVIIIDSNTDNENALADPKSKISRITNALTRFDNQPEEKITVPVQVLKGGYREWLLKYPHFTTNPDFNPDAPLSDITNGASPANPRSLATTSQPSSSAKETLILNPQNLVISGDNAHSERPNGLEPSFRPSAPPVHLYPSSPTSNKSKPISKPVPIPPAGNNRLPPQLPAAGSKPNIVKNAPGTAVPITPVSFIRSALPRSHSSPNVAQADGDEIDELEQLGRMTVGAKPNDVAISYGLNNVHSNNNNSANNYIQPSSSAPSKPRFDRTLKPSLNHEAISAIRARLNFGRSPEASGKAITGLQNLGNTCFMNSVIQCLAYAPDLADYLCSDSYYNHINFNNQYGTKGELAVEFAALIERLNAHRHRYIEPKSFRETIVRHIGFAGNEQQDSHEFMMMLFDKLHHDLNVHAKDKSKQNGFATQSGADGNDDDNINIPRATLGYQFWKRHLDANKSVISELFEGIFMSTLTCTFCRGQSNTFEVFNCLSLPIPSETRCHLRECLSHFSNPERIEAAWECPRCKQKREADKKIVICKLPRILIIHLKRFSLDGRWRQKLQTTVDFPLSDLNVDCTNVLPQSAYGGQTHRLSYNLCAVVNHYGHLDGGHYTAFCKLDNHRWYTFDDSNVYEMRDADVCSQAAYILFYAIEEND